MTGKRRLIPLKEVRETLDLLASLGVDIKACSIDIREDGISVSPLAQSVPDAYERWSKANPG